MEFEEEIVEKETKAEERAIGSIGNVKVTGDLVITRMVDGRTITESSEEIKAKNAEYKAKTERLVKETLDPKPVLAWCRQRREEVKRLKAEAAAQDQGK